VPPIECWPVDRCSGTAGRSSSASAGYPHALDVGGGPNCCHWTGGATALAVGMATHPRNLGASADGGPKGGADSAGSAVPQTDRDVAAPDRGYARRPSRRTLTGTVLRRRHSATIAPIHPNGARSGTHGWSLTALLPFGG
jgi:hypothetical protein